MKMAVRLKYSKKKSRHKNRRYMEVEEESNRKARLQIQMRSAYDVEKSPRCDDDDAVGARGD